MSFTIVPHLWLYSPAIWLQAIYNYSNQHYRFILLTFISSPWEGTWEYKLKALIKIKSQKITAHWPNPLKHSKVHSITYCLLLLLCYKGKAEKESVYSTMSKIFTIWTFTERVYWPLYKIINSSEIQSTLKIPLCIEIKIILIIFIW